MIEMLFRVPRRIALATEINALLAMAASTTAIADAAPENLYGLRIEDARVAAAQVGGGSVLRVRIVNEGAEPLLFLGAKSKEFGTSIILARTQHSHPAVPESVTVPVEESLDLASHHLLVKLSGLRREFNAGETVSLNLSFLRGTVPIQAHVH